MMKTNLAIRLMVLVSCASIACARTNKDDYRDLETAKALLTSIDGYHSASINKIIDDNLSIFQNLLSSLEPIILPDVELRKRGSLSNGTVTQLAEINRTGPCNMTYSNQILSLNLRMGWEDIVYKYNYKFRFVVTTKRGRLQGHIRNLRFNLKVFYNFITRVITLQSFKFTHAGSFDLEVEGSAHDRLLSKIGKLILELAKPQIIKRIQLLAIDEVKRVIDKINKNISH